MKVAAALAVALTLAGCAASDRPASKAAEGQLTVFAAASLTEPFEQLGEKFEQTHPGADVTFSFGPSSGLAQQIVQGAPADVFASASASTMDVVTAAGAAASATTFAGNTLQVAVPKNNPARISGVRDLSKTGVKVAVCQAKVPCGQVAEQVFAAAGVRVQPVTEEVDVKAVLAKVRLGEVDAGLVYVTDVKAAGGDVRGIAIPDDVNASTDYQVAVLSTSKQPADAQAFVDLVQSVEGRQVLAAAGFTNP